MYCKYVYEYGVEKKMKKNINVKNTIPHVFLFGTNEGN
jgi:hypothetical protein